jgi:hypothetical protein
VNNSGTLKGSGSITQSGTFSNASGSHIAPGNSPGTLTIKGNFNLGSATLDEEINGPGAGQFDVLNITGTATVGSATLNVVSSYTLTSADQLTLINAGAVSGTLSGALPAGTSISYNFPAAGQVTLSSANAPPVLISGFKARHAAEGNVLEWTTAAERPGTYFRVMRSVDGNNFTEKQRVDGAGMPQTYTHRDGATANAVTYYKICVMADGKATFTNTLAVNGAAQHSAGITIAPVPANGSVWISCTDSGLRGSYARILSAAGLEVARIRLEVRTSIDLGGWPSGTYTVHVVGAAPARIVVP